MHPSLPAVSELLADLERAVTEYGVLLRRKQPIRDERVLIQRKLNRLRVLTHGYQEPEGCSELYKVALKALLELATEVEQAFEFQFTQEKP